MERRKAQFKKLLKKKQNPWILKGKKELRLIYKCTKILKFYTRFKFFGNKQKFSLFTDQNAHSLYYLYKIFAREKKKKQNIRHANNEIVE